MHLLLHGCGLSGETHNRWSPNNKAAVLFFYFMQLYLILYLGCSLFEPFNRYFSFLLFLSLLLKVAVCFVFVFFILYLLSLNNY